MSRFRFHLFLLFSGQMQVVVNLACEPHRYTGINGEFKGVHGSREQTCNKRRSIIHIYMYKHTYIPTTILRAWAVVMINVWLTPISTKMN